MTRPLGSADLDTDAVMPLIQDAWNYFPHRSLEGKCPRRFSKVCEVVVSDHSLARGPNRLAESNLLRRMGTSFTEPLPC
jgi:hypothetical protein